MQADESQKDRSPLPNKKVLRVVSVSGGKDSTALYLWAIEEFGREGFVAVFSNTDHEHPVTLSYVKGLARIANGPEIHIVKRSFRSELGSKATGIAFFDLMQWKQRAPSPRAQFCTTELKMVPIREFIEGIRGEREVEVYVGIRKEESIARSKLGVREYSDFYDGWLLRPLLEWNEERVWGLLRMFHIDRNPLYSLGWSRVGCFPCIHSNKAELAILPAWAWSKLSLWEEKIRRTFFSPNKISGVILCRAELVRKWSKTGWGNKSAPKHEITEKDTGGCMSTFGMCE